MPRRLSKFKPEGFRVTEITSAEATLPLLEFHYLHRRASFQFPFDLFDAGGELRGVITYGPPASPQVGRSACPTRPKDVIEFNRMWTCDALDHGAETWFIARTLRKLPALVVVSYSDLRQGHEGSVYRAANFHFAGRTGKHFDVSVGGLHPRHAHERGGISLRKGLRISRSIKHRYWITTGSRKQRKKLRRIVAWPSLPWKVIE